MHCLTFRNVTKVTGLCWNIFGGEGTACLVVFESGITGIMQYSAGLAGCSGPGEEKLCNEKILLPQFPLPYFKVLEVTDGSSLSWEENFESYLRLKILNK